jgi:hypothetical protein
MELEPVELVRQARASIWRLFDAELLDEDLATAAMLAICIGYRRRRKQSRDGTWRSLS